MHGETPQAFYFRKRFSVGEALYYGVRPVGDMYNNTQYALKLQDNITFNSLVLNRVVTTKKGIGTLTITRHDAAPSDLVEGNFEFAYTDLLLVEHEIRGIFRLKRTA